ncbi:DsbA family protein [Paenibacillus sp. FSL R10-2734]|uniref:DsbA family oxidoreductase n=1 Tax=Paenibacillus sp. FSL R10-2734 TaxID=2954691 RepID=UPI0030D968E9
MNNSNMMCDLKTGVCGPGDEEQMEMIDFNQLSPKITLYYATDPICSHCWALEPVLNRFILQYGQYFNVKTIMGGLLSSWNGFADAANGIQKPSDVAEHWREVGLHSRMPIDGSLWTNNPILSSYPPSRVYKVIQSKYPGKENEFLRRAREAVFAFNQNIGEDQVLVEIVNQIGLNGEEIVADAALESAQDLLEQDFELAGRLGVRGFPSIIMVNEDNKGVKIVGVRSLDAYVEGLEQVHNGVVKAQNVPPLTKLFKEGDILFSKEMEVLYDIEASKVEPFIATELIEGSYLIKDVLGEAYVVSLS